MTHLPHSAPQFMNDGLSRILWPQFIKTGISIFGRTKALPILYPAVDFNNVD